MRRLFVIGIGAGDPDYLTLQAIEALQQVDVFFVMDKGREKDDLLRLRKEICERHITARRYRTVETPDPERARDTDAYEPAVRAWHARRTDLYERLIGEELREDECGAFLAWGDPSLYDSTLRILDEVAARGAVRFRYDIIPGISAIQALAARHKITLNRIGRSVHVTTGRKMAEGLPAGLDDIVVMLDATCAFKAMAEFDVDIYWGAYLGTKDEVLVAGKVRDVMHDIERKRAEAKARKGWIMDTYLLRKREG